MKVKLVFRDKEDLKDLQDMFEKVKWVAWIWYNPEQLPKLPDWCKYKKDDINYIAKRIAVDSYSVQYSSLCQTYTFKPDSLTIEGEWGIILEGNEFCSIEPFTYTNPPFWEDIEWFDDNSNPKNKKIDGAKISIYIPIGPEGLLVYSEVFYYPIITFE